MNKKHLFSFCEFTKDIPEDIFSIDGECDAIIIIDWPHVIIYLFTQSSDNVLKENTTKSTFSSTCYIMFIYAFLNSYTLDSI